MSEIKRKNYSGIEERDRERETGKERLRGADEQLEQC